MWDRAGGQRKRWPPTIHSSLARSFTYSLSSLVSILSPLCVLLIYRAAGKCLRHSPSIVQPISLSCSSYFSTFVSLAATFYSLRPSVPLANVLHPSLSSLYRGSLTPFFVPNILTDSDYKEFPRG